MLKRKIMCLVLAAATALSPLTATAVDLGSAFTNLLGPGAGATVNSPGRYQSGARTGFTAGGLDVRLPRPGNAPALFSVTPPKFEAGCNGISAHFGGFSFISGAEFEALLKQIASGAVTGFVTSLLFKTLCPQCEAVIQELKTAAQMASRLARDSCQIGRQMADRFLGGIGGTPDAQPECALTVSRQNGSADALMAFDSLCGGLGKIRDSLRDFNQSTAKWLNGATGTPEQQALAKDLSADCGSTSGNLTWSRLSAMDSSGVINDNDEGYRRKLLLLNIMGAELRHGSEAASCDLGDGGLKETSESKETNEVYCPPRLAAQQLVGAFMCGDPDQLQAMRKAGSNSAVLRYCSDVYNTDKKSTEDSANQGWVCADDTNMASRARCLKLKLAPVTQIIKGKGFLLQVNDLLRSGVQRVRENKSFTGVDSNGVDGKDIVALMQVAPYPLYQAINAAAIYPAAAEDLVDTISVLVAEQFAYAMFDEVIRLPNRSSTAGAYCVSRNQADRILEFIGNLRAFNASRRQQIAQNFAVQEGITEQIRQLNVAIQRQVITADMLHSGSAAQMFNKAVNRSISSPTPGTPAPTTP